MCVRGCCTIRSPRRRGPGARGARSFSMQNYIGATHHGGTGEGGDATLYFTGILRVNGITSSPRDGATDWIAAKYATPEIPISRSAAARATRGAISFRTSNHFALRPYSKDMKPVAFPPGRAKLLTNPAPTGSGTTVNTIGAVRVTCSKGPTATLPVAWMTWGCKHDQFLRICEYY